MTVPAKGASARARLVFAVAVVVAGVFAWLVVREGVPTMRHDWALPTSAQGWRAYMVTTASGWGVGGIGDPRAYPTLFLLGPLISVIGLVFGSLAAIGTFIGLISVSVLAGGVRIAEASGLNRWIGVLLGAVLLFSPWMYEEVVAGHLTMALSFGACTLLAGELLAARPRRWLVILLAFVAAFQIQFSFVSIAIAVAVRFELRSVLLTCIGTFLSLLPSIVGIISLQRTLLAIPFTFQWQHNNSVAPASGMLLDGYATNYTSHAHWLFVLAAWCLVFCALAGAVHGLSRPRIRLRIASVVVLVFAILAYASGFRGPFAHLYQLSLHVPQTLVFRELYDLVGAVAILYAVLASLAAAHFRFARAALLCSACLLLGAWFAWPPSQWWLSAARLPAIRVDTTFPNVRFALMPWRQPMNFDGEGSGADPDAFARANNVTPLNQYEDTYPSNAALALLANNGDARDLEALSVATVYDRPYFATDDAALRAAVPVPPGREVASATRKLHPLPEMSIGSVPPTRDIPGSPHELYLFGGGDPTQISAHLATVSAPRASSDPNRHWIAGDLVFSSYPEVANAFGGAFTLARNVWLTVPSWSPRGALVFVKGTLTSERGAILTTSTHGWKWIDLHWAMALGCNGLCEVAAWERQPYGDAPRQRAARTASREVAFRPVLPFLIRGTVPALSGAGNRLLLYRSRYNAAWKMFGISGARHVEVSNLFNGYVLPPSASGKRFYLVYTTAVLQSFAMILSVAGLITGMTLRLRPAQ